MSQDIRRNYVFLDGQTERRQLIAEIARARQAVVQMVDSVPEAEWYAPRYHGWSLAAMLAHLHFTDNLIILTIKLGLLNLRFPIPARVWDQINDFMARVFQRRQVSTTVRGIEKNEQRIADFILHLPMNSFTKQVYDPPLSKYLTVEQALQEFFLYHWLGHLKTLREVEGVPSDEDFT